MPVVSEEITRLQGAKADIKAAIESKGVIVPSTAKLDDYSGLIEQISGGTSPLPYTPLEYIETDGTAYINSGINSRALMTCDIKVKINASVSSSEIFVGTGNTDGANATVNFLYHSTANLSKIGYGYYYLYSGRLTPSSFSSPFEVSTFLQGGYCYMTIREYGSSPVSVAHNLNRIPSNSTPFYIFATNNGGTAANKASSGSRIYYVRISYLSTAPSIVFDGVPALYNGEYGLWDNVSNSFFGNANNSGAFTGQ